MRSTQIYHMFSDVFRWKLIPATPDLSKQNPPLSHRCHANGQTGLACFFSYLHTRTHTHCISCMYIYIYYIQHKHTRAHIFVWMCYYRLLFARLVDMNTVCVRAHICTNSILYPFQPKYLFNQLDYHRRRPHRWRTNLIRSFWPEKHKLPGSTYMYNVYLRDFGRAGRYDKHWIPVARKVFKAVFVEKKSTL